MGFKQNPYWVSLRFICAIMYDCIKSTLHMQVTKGSFPIRSRIHDWENMFFS